MSEHIGASIEVIEQHAREHERKCGGECEERLCPCGLTVMLVCTTCDEPVFLAVAPDSWCPHAAAAWDELIG